MKKIFLLLILLVLFGCSERRADEEEIGNEKYSELEKEMNIILDAGEEIEYEHFKQIEKEMYDLLEYGFDISEFRDKLHRIRLKAKPEVLPEKPSVSNEGEVVEEDKKTEEHKERPECNVNADCNKADTLCENYKCNTYDRNEKLWLYNIGTNVEPWDKKTGMAGDVRFTGLKEHGAFFEYGADEGDGSLSPHPVFFLPLGSGVFSVSDGIVVSVNVIEYSGDYDVGVIPKQGSMWEIHYEHVINVRVKKGDRVKAGQVIADVTSEPWSDEFGKWALMIIKKQLGPDDITNACPYEHFHASVKEEYQGKLSQLIEDWEDFVNNDSFYDEETWHSPGCRLGPGERVDKKKVI